MAFLKVDENHDMRHFKHMRREQVENEEAGRTERSGYPYMSLKPAMKVSDAVKVLGGARIEVQKSVLAHQLNEKEKSPSLSQRISSAKCFGLVGGRGAYTLTDLARQYYFPTTDTEQKQALLRIVSAPQCFGQLIRRFDGDKVPEKKILSNLLHRDFNVPESWKERVAAFFVSSLDLAGLVDAQGILRYGSAQNGGMDKATLSSAPESAAPVSAKAELTPAAQPVATAPVVQTGLGVNVWNFSHKGKVVRLETPTELDLALWAKLNGYVELLKPLEGNE